MIWEPTIQKHAGATFTSAPTARALLAMFVCGIGAGLVIAAALAGTL